MFKKIQSVTILFVFLLCSCVPSLVHSMDRGKDTDEGTSAGPQNSEKTRTQRDQCIHTHHHTHQDSPMDIRGTGYTQVSVTTGNIEDLTTTDKIAVLAQNTAFNFGKGAQSANIHADKATIYNNTFGDPDSPLLPRLIAGLLNSVVESPHQYAVQQVARALSWAQMEFVEPFVVDTAKKLVFSLDMNDDPSIRALAGPLKWALPSLGAFAQLQQQKSDQTRILTMIHKNLLNNDQRIEDALKRVLALHEPNSNELTTVLKNMKVRNDKKIVEAALVLYSAESPHTTQQLTSTCQNIEQTTKDLNHYFDVKKQGALSGKPYYQQLKTKHTRRLAQQAQIRQLSLAKRKKQLQAKEHKITTKIKKSVTPEPQELKVSEQTQQLLEDLV